MQQYPESSSIEAPIPAPPRPRHYGRYAKLMEIVRQTEDCVCCVDLDLIAGRDIKAKVSTLHSAAFNRKMKIATTTQNSFVYLKEVR